MESPRPMERLVCGDVGFGKTEVAMRAAFKALQDGLQVAVLAPTTVLAFQHWNTFRARFAAFPVTIEMISRFRTPAEQRAVAARVKSGAVDILIGTTGCCRRTWSSTGWACSWWTRSSASAWRTRRSSRSSPTAWTCWC